MGFNSGFKGLNIRYTSNKVSRANKFCAVTPDICGSSAGNFLPVILPVPRIVSGEFVNPSINLKSTRQAMGIQRNIEARSRNQYCCGKAIGIVHSRGYAVPQVFTALRCKSEGRRFDSRWDHMIVSLN